ncbi:hypothetical protein ACET3X_008806 [Alternaria dauci]|uniref:Uncharacterized protein n=1 Tax=Alternaria dauci TaxID=48095 RepID=A0ABR3U8U5_9PLEO
MMLSTLQPSHPSTTPPYSQSSAMSSMTTTQLPIIPPPRQAPRRPKLSINTEQPRILGKGASLRLETLSAVSPTVRNTFSNAYERPATVPQAQPATPSSASTLSSTATSASTDSATSSIPYKQPHNLSSILANSPARAIIPRKMGSSTRPMFPAAKRVSFRTPLEEEITTTKYTLAHSDLESSSSTLSSLSSSESEAEACKPSLSLKPALNMSNTSISPLQLSISSTASSVESSPKRSPRTGEKRDSSSSEDDSDSAPETPVAGRRKRTRDWRWTLGPLPSDSKTSSLSSASEGTISEDSS